LSETSSDILREGNWKTRGMSSLIMPLHVGEDVGNMLSPRHLKGEACILMEYEL